MAIANILYGGFGFDCPFATTVCPRVVTLIARQTADVFLSVLTTTTVRFVRCRKHSRQQPLLVSSHELVSCGKGGNSTLYQQLYFVYLQQIASKVYEGNYLNVFMRSNSETK